MPLTCKRSAFFLFPLLGDPSPLGKGFVIGGLSLLLPGKMAATVTSLSFGFAKMAFVFLVSPGVHVFLSGYRSLLGVLVNLAHCHASAILILLQADLKRLEPFYGSPLILFWTISLQRCGGHMVPFGSLVQSCITSRCPLISLIILIVYMIVIESQFGRAGGTKVP